MTNRRFISLVVVSLVVVFLSLALWTKQGQGGAVARQAWEYKILVYVDEFTKSTLYEDGKQVPGTPVSRAPELGSQGWELVAIAAVPYAPGSASGTAGTAFFRYSYWFKRPK